MSELLKLKASPVRPNRQKAGASEVRDGALSAAFRNEWFAVDDWLHTLVWRDGKWVVLVQAPAGRATLQKDDHVEACVATPEALLALTAGGVLLRLDERGWQEVSRAPEGFAPRSGFLACFDPVMERIVVWGKNLDAYVPEPIPDETYFIHGGKWSSPSGQASRLAMIEAQRFRMIFDYGSDKVVRLGKKSVGVLEGDAWQEVMPEGYSGLVQPGGFLASDPQSRQTLIYNFKQIHRFSLAGCAPVAQIDKLVSPSGLVPNWVYMPDRRELHLQDAKDGRRRLMVDLAPAFELVAGRDVSVGPAEKPTRPPKATKLDKDARAKLAGFFAKLCTLEVAEQLGACSAYVFDWAKLPKGERDDCLVMLGGVNLADEVPFAVLVRDGGLGEMREDFGGSPSRWKLSHYLGVQNDGVLAVGSQGELVHYDEGSRRTLARTLAPLRLTI